MKQNQEKKVAESFLNFIKEKAGLSYYTDRTDFLLDKVRQRMKICNIESYDEYLEYMKQSQASNNEFNKLVDILTITETYFFRNQPQLESFANLVLPQVVNELLDEAQGVLTNQNLNIWSAGCSTGEEAYTLAMIIKQKLDLKPHVRVSIIATDINQNALEKAKKGGGYNHRSVQYVPADLLASYFELKEGLYYVKKEIKDMVNFKLHNLVSLPFVFPSTKKFHVVFCRNVMIYFGVDVMQSVIERFSETLVPNGFLLIGHSETLWGLSDEFTPIRFGDAFIYRKQRTGKEGVKRDVNVVTVNSLSNESDAKKISLREAQSGKMKKSLKSLKEEKSPLPELKINKKQKEEKSSFDTLSKVQALIEGGQTEKAISSLVKIVEKDKLNSHAYFLLGMLYLQQKEYESAISEFKKGLYVDSEYILCYFYLANIYQLHHKYDLAIREYNICKKLLLKHDKSDVIPFSDGLKVKDLEIVIDRSVKNIKNK